MHQHARIALWSPQHPGRSIQTADREQDRCHQDQASDNPDRMLVCHDASPCFTRRIKTDIINPVLQCSIKRLIGRSATQQNPHENEVWKGVGSAIA
jgi:hypothetical protein